MRELRKKQEKKIKELEDRVENEEYMVHLHDERLKKVRTAKKVVAALANTR
jgi:RNase H-fold protein (predicted Holliday junction resolvase)